MNFANRRFSIIHGERFPSVGRRACAIALFLLVAAHTGFAAAAGDLKTSFLSLLNGRYAKVIWISPSNQIWGMDTKDCTPHKITSDADLPPNNATLNFPSMTWDQSRVVVTNTKNMSVYVANFDGSGGFKKIATGYYTGYAWQGGGKHWILASPKTSSMAANASVVRMNIDSPYDTVLIWNKTTVGGGATMHASLSVDGTRLAENFPHPKMGTARVPNGAIVFRKKTEEVCIPSISRDNNYNVLCFTANHTDFCIFDSTGTDILYKTFSGILPFNSTTNRAENLRWTNDFDIATVDGCVVRISDLTYVDLGASVGGATAMDLFIYGSVSTREPPRLNRKSPDAASPVVFYDCLGRMVSVVNFAARQNIQRSGVAFGAAIGKNGRTGQGYLTIVRNER